MIRPSRSLAEPLRSKLIQDSRDRRNLMRISSAEPGCFKRSESGSMTVEAAILLPCLMMLVMLMVSLIRLASVEIALQSAVTETGKSIAGNWQPVRMVYAEAKARAESSRAGVWTQNLLSKLENWHSRWSGAEEWVLKYEAVLPDPIVNLLKWEVQQREALEDSIGEEAESTIRKMTDPLLCRAFDPLLWHYANGQILNPDKLHVSAIQLPSMESGGSAIVEVTASYEYRLPVPFWNPTFLLKRKSYERAWVGDE